jgi:ATP-binding cassette, subfamily B, bacterial CvaB/MchF/RaxB
LKSLQSTAAECSIACLANVANAHGTRLTLDDLRRRFPISLKGATLKSLIAHAAALDFSSRALRADVDELNQLKLPCILHWDLNHFVVLEKVSSSRKLMTILDPAVGTRRLSFSEASRHFTGIVLELTPNVDFRANTVRAPRLKLAQLTGKVRGLSTALAQLFAVALVLQLFAIAAPLFNQIVVDEVITSNDADLLTVLVLGFALLMLVQTALALARSWMVMVLGQTLSLQWVSNVFSHLVKLPVQWFEQRHLGDITSRFGAVGAIQRTITTALIESVLDGVMVVAALGMMLLYSPMLSAVVVVAVALYGLVRWASYRPLRDAAHERLIVAAKENSHFLETLRAIQPLKLYGRESERRNRWQNLIVDVQNRDVRTAKLNIGFTTANTFIFGMENLLVFWLGAKLVMGAQVGSQTAGVAPFTIGMLFAFISYKGQFATRISALIDYAVELKMLSLHAERLGDIALTAPEQDLPSGNLPLHDLAHLAPSLELRNVSFRYGEGEPWVLKDANFHIDAGQSVAVTGASGVGKTTLLKILLGILPPNEGQVLYGGIPVRQLGLANVRQRIGTVMQEDVLLSGSLADNISFFDTQPEQDRVESCAAMAQLHDDIRRMPMGYHTLVGDMGTSLSGGQKQRLLLARALYKQPSVLALDEATSHLDLTNERHVTHALASMSLTRLIIAHRPETIAGAQHVVQIKDGQVVDVMRAMPAR